MMKIRLAAIAKDEGAYLPEWIYWHLAKGFDDIYICVNNSSDNSEIILNAIAKEHSITINVLEASESYGFHNHLIDEKFLNRNPLQAKIYADIYAQSAAEGFSHVMFLDIDEFLFSKHGSIQDILFQSHNADVVLFNWFNLSGDPKEFTCTVPPFIGEPSDFTKYILKTQLNEVQFLSSHNVKAKNITKFLYGRAMTNDNKNYIKDTGWTSDTFILHRHLRSKLEYLSRLRRGSPWNNSMIGLKRNRKGWSDTGKQELSAQQLHPHTDEKAFKSFLQKCGIEKELIRSQNYIREKAQETTALVHKLRDMNSDLDKMLAGTGLSHTDRRFKYAIKRWVYEFSIKHFVNRHE